MRRTTMLWLAALAIAIGCHKPPPATPTTQPSGVTVPAHFGATSPRSAWSDYEDLGADASGVVKSGQHANLFGVYAINNNASIRYLQFFDSTTAPASSAAPRLQFGIPGGGGEIIIGTDFWQAQGIAFDKAIAWGISTTKGSFVAATAGDHDLMVIYQ